MSLDHASDSLIFDTSADRFVADVIEGSRTVAVAVDFWAPWCAPCRTLAPILEDLVRGYAGRLQVARVNTDEEPAIAAQFGIRSIPDVRIFRDGRQIDGFVGVHPESWLQALFDKYVPRASAGLREQARARLQAGDAAGAVTLLQNLLADDPENSAARIELADGLARSGDAEAADSALAALPVNVAAGKEADAVRARIHFLRTAAADMEVAALRHRVSDGDADLDAMHRLAAYELLNGDATRGLELLLGIMRRDRRLKDDLGRRSLLQAFQLLGETDERVGAYRRKMTALLY